MNISNLLHILLLPAVLRKPHGKIFLYWVAGFIYFITVGLYIIYFPVLHNIQRKLHLWEYFWPRMVCAGSLRLEDWLKLQMPLRTAVSFLLFLLSLAFSWGALVKTKMNFLSVQSAHRWPCRLLLSWGTIFGLEHLLDLPDIATTVKEIVLLKVTKVKCMWFPSAGAWDVS